MGSKRILVIGDRITDQYIEAESYRLSAEAPVPIIEDYKDFTLPGGAANVDKLLTELGNRTVFVSGQNSMELPYPTKIRICAGGQQIVRIDVGDRIFNSIDWGEIVSTFIDVNAVVVADYGKGSVSKSLAAMILNGANSYNIPTFVHTKGDPLYYMLAHTDIEPILFCNYHEYKKYLEEYDSFKCVIRSNGEHGAEIVNKGHCSEIVPAYSDNPVCVNGAGDALMAGFVHRYVHNGLPSRLHALRFGSAAAALTIERPYTGYLNGEDEVNARFAKEYQQREKGYKVVGHRDVVDE